MDNHKNNKYRHDKHQTFTNKNGEKWIYKSPRKAKGKSYTALVLEYLREEWGLQNGLLSDDAIEYLMDMIDNVAYKGQNPANSAALVMEQMWEYGVERPDFEDTN